MGWIIGIEKEITWTTEDWYYIDAFDVPQADSVKIELSRNDGSTWETIVASTPNTGSYNWVVTGGATVQAKLRLSGVNNTDVSFTSAAAFEIEAQVLTSATIFPVVASVCPDAITTFTVVGYDQEGNAMVVQPDNWVWAVSGGGTIDGGVFTAGSEEGGPYEVTATSGGVEGSASVTVRKFTGAGCGINISLAIGL
jgi:hypothetical protein